MEKLILYHGSSKIIEKPVYGAGKPWNDYGRGFYCTQNKELSKEWACPDNNDGFSNCYEIQTDDLKILNLQGRDFNILHWLTILIQNRKFDLDTPIMRQADFYLKNNFSIDLTNFDAIIGYRADDSYFSFARAFLSNAISLEQLKIFMSLGKLGEQFMLKSSKAFDLIKFSGYEIAEARIYSSRRKKRDSDAKNQYKELLSNNDISGLFIRDLILREVKSDDECLR